MNYPLDPHGEMILQEYRDYQPIFKRLDELVYNHLSRTLQEQGIYVTSIEHRIKQEASLAGKLMRKGHKYTDINSLTDIVGVRIITFYTDDVDKVAAIVKRALDVDWKESVDKRKLHDLDSFGYNSLHYICKIPKTLYQNSQHPELNSIYFELQMRTALQHVWSAIQHDIGYKTDIETPMEYHRSLSRLAGLLELADNEFSRIRNSISDYRRRAQSLVQSGKLDEVQLDGDTFQSYLSLRPFDKLNQKIASITRAEIHEANLRPYLSVLKLLGMNTLADVEKLQKDNFDDAYQLALYQLGSTDIDILAENVGIQNLCIVYILKSGGGKIGLMRLFNQVNGTMPQNEILASMVMEQASRLSFMNTR